MPSYKTHLAATIIPSLYIISELDLYNLNPIYPALSLSCMMLGSLLPDIDIPSSFLGRWLFPISWIINKLFGHRGLFHSITFYTIIFILLPLYHTSCMKYCTYGVVLVSLYIGIVLHIVLDKLTTHIKMKRYQKRKYRRRGVCFQRK